MDNFAQAADDARRLLRGFKAFEEVAAALDKAATLEQRVPELERAVAAAQQRYDDAQAMLRETEDAIALVREHATQISANAETRATMLLADMKAEGEAILTAAREEAARIAAEARNREAQADAHVVAATARRDAVHEETVALEARAQSAREFLANLTKG